jgi:hypothetical protein
MPAGGLEEEEAGAHQEAAHRAQDDLPDLENERDERPDQLDREEKSSGDRTADPGEEPGNWGGDRSQAAARLVRRPAQPRPQIALGPHRPPCLTPAAAGHRPGLRAGQLGELLLASLAAAAASRRAAESLPGSHQTAAIIIGRSGVPPQGTVGDNRFDGERRDIGAVRVSETLCARARKGLFSALIPNSD